MLWLSNKSKPQPDRVAAYFYIQSHRMAAYNRASSVSRTTSKEVGKKKSADELKDNKWDNKLQSAVADFYIERMVSPASFHRRGSFLKGGSAVSIRGHKRRGE
ncbi:hypothetical protein AM501_29905 [Aneurinibacillus migulanus]|nr:hypothetical protein TS64_03500 [Aneurinibacillus migulanus]KPD04811.1 hypothetical protein AM501_29905 [Aneurinibacillus migulanus]